MPAPPHAEPSPPAPTARLHAAVRRESALTTEPSSRLRASASGEGGARESPIVRLVSVILLSLLGGCAASPTPDLPAAARAPRASLSAPTPAPGASETASLDSPSPTAVAPEPPAVPVERFDPSLPTEVPVAGDLAARVAHGAIGNRRAIVYLHGHCGNVEKFRDWQAAGVRFGTVVALFGDDKCKEPGRFKWGSSAARTDQRIQAALKAVSAVRDVPLDLGAVTLVGYSQGSARAEALVRAYPTRYPRAILVAGPKEHAAQSFREALGIAVVGGQRDLTAHLKDAADKAVKAGVHARYFELPGARHGEYGPDAVKVMGEALSWVFTPPAPAPASPAPTP